MKKLAILPALLLALVCLMGCGAEAKESSYTIACRGEDGTPVAGVMINFCTDTACSPVSSGEDGNAVFTGAPEEYHVQIVRVPAGWELLGEAEWTTKAESQSFTLTFREAGK